MTTYVLRDGKLVEKSKAAPLENKSAYIINDIKPYLSTIDGQPITSRSSHRQHLKQHNCIEVGNENLAKHIKKKGYEKRDIKRDIYNAMEKLNVRR